MGRWGVAKTPLVTPLTAGKVRPMDDGIATDWAAFFPRRSRLRLQLRVTGRWLCGWSVRVPQHDQLAQPAGKTPL